MKASNINSEHLYGITWTRSFRQCLIPNLRGEYWLKNQFAQIFWDLGFTGQIVSYCWQYSRAGAKISVQTECWQYSRAGAKISVQTESFNWTHLVGSLFYQCRYEWRSPHLYCYNTLIINLLLFFKQCTCFSRIKISKSQ